MREINKIDGDVDQKNKNVRTVDLDDSVDSATSLTHSATFFGAITSEATTSKDSEFLKKAHGLCFKTKFHSPLINTTEDSITVNFELRHSIHKGHILDKMKEYIPGINSHIDCTEFPIYSYLQLRFTRDQSRIFLNIKCNAFVDIYDFDFTQLLIILADNSCSALSTSECDQTNIMISERLVNPVGMRSKLPVRQLTMDDGMDVTPILDSVHNYKLNCLKRFEELSVVREPDAYQCSQNLGKILSKINKNYMAVTPSDFKLALILLDKLESNITYQNDPQIWLSMTKIREALELLSKRAQIFGRGVEIEDSQLIFILKELEYHEGVKPTEGSWFPHGTIDQLREKLTEFYPFLGQGIELVGIK